MATSREIKTDQGWSWLILVAGFLANLTFDGIIFSFGMFYREFLDHFQATNAGTSWVGSVISGVYALVGPIASVLANKFGCRIVTVVGSLLAAAGFIACTFAPNLAVMIITYGVLGGVGFGFMYLCSYVMVGHYFKKYRALATGITSCGSGVGTFIFAPLSVTLIENFGWKGGMWIIAGIVLNGIVIGAVFRSIPQSTTEENGAQNEKQPLMDYSLLKNPAFLLMAFSSFLCMIGFFVPFVYLPDYAHKNGISRENGAFLLSIMGICNTLGRIVCGWLSDKTWVDPLKMYTAALIIGGGCTMVCSFIDTYVMLACYAAVFGACVAAYVALCAIILVEFLGLERLSNSFGLLNMSRGVATFIGAPIAGFLFDLKGDYDLAFYVAGAAIAAAGLICVPLRLFIRCTPSCCNVASIEQIEKNAAVAASTIDLTGSCILMQASESRVGQVDPK